MKKFFLISLALCWMHAVAVGQNFETDSLSKAEISRLSFIVGEWEGTGWMMSPDGQKHPFQQTENVQFKIDSTAILIEGLGKAGEKVIHNALAVISLDKAQGGYAFQSYLSNGRGGNFKAELKEDTLYWYPGENMRYIISLNEKGQWAEVGEMNRDGNWFQFLEMTLDKKTD